MRYLVLILAMLSGITMAAGFPGPREVEKLLKDGEILTCSVLLYSEFKPYYKQKWAQIEDVITPMFTTSSFSKGDKIVFFHLIEAHRSIEFTKKVSYLGVCYSNLHSGYRYLLKEEKKR